MELIIYPVARPTYGDDNGYLGPEVESLVGDDKRRIKFDLIV